MCLYGTVTHMKLKNIMLLAIPLRVSFTDKYEFVVMIINPILNQLKLDLYNLHCWWNVKQCLLHTLQIVTIFCMRCVDSGHTNNNRACDSSK